MQPEEAAAVAAIGFDDWCGIVDFDENFTEEDFAESDCRDF